MTYSNNDGPFISMNSGPADQVSAQRLLINQYFEALHMGCIVGANFFLWVVKELMLQEAYE